MIRVLASEKYGIEKVYQEIDQVFEDPDVDIIYISTPLIIPIHYLRKALAAGKHVLCEKSITLNSEELAEAIHWQKKIMSNWRKPGLFSIADHLCSSEIVDSGVQALSRLSR